MANFQGISPLFPVVLAAIVAVAFLVAIFQRPAGRTSFLTKTPVMSDHQTSGKMNNESEVAEVPQSGPSNLVMRFVDGCLCVVEHTPLNVRGDPDV